MELRADVVVDHAAELLIRQLPFHSLRRQELHQEPNERCLSLRLVHQVRHESVVHGSRTSAAVAAFFLLPLEGPHSPTPRLFPPSSVSSIRATSVCSKPSSFPSRSSRARARLAARDCWVAPRRRRRRRRRRTRSRSFHIPQLQC